VAPNDRVVCLIYCPKLKKLRFLIFEGNHKKSEAVSIALHIESFVPTMTETAGQFTVRISVHILCAFANGICQIEHSSQAFIDL